MIIVTLNRMDFCVSRYEFNDPRYGEDYARLGPAIEGQWDWVTEMPVFGVDIIRDSCKQLKKAAA